MANISGGANTANKVNVDTNYNLNVVTPQTEIQAGFVQLSSEVDAGSILGTRTVRAAEISQDYRLRVGNDSPVFNLSFEGTVIAQAHLQQNLTTMTTAQTSGLLSLNSGNATASGNAANIKTYRTFALLGSYTTYVDMWVREANPTATNTVSEWGLGYVATTNAPTDGILFRRLSGGQLQAVINFAGTENISVINETNIPSRDGSGTYDATEINHYLISSHNDSIEFWINDILVATILTPSTQGGASSSSTQPIFARVYNSGVASAARRVEIAFIQAATGDAITNKPWAQQIAGSGGGAYQIQPGTASGPTVLRTGATNGWPASATAKTTNAWAANTGPADASLGGRWLSPAISTLTSETDYPLFSYQNPAGTNTLPGKNLYITGIRVGETSVQTAAAANPITFFFCAACASTATSFATAEGAATVAPRILPLGSQSFISSASVGTYVDGFDFDLQAGSLVVPPGTFFHIVCRPVGTVTSNTLVVQGTMSVIGYFE
jgi:hypothetical protein